MKYKKYAYILKDLSNGYTVPEIAVKRGLNQRTLEGYVDTIKEELEARTLAQLINRAYKKGILKVS
jgi:DNA-binding NarL/FixJ family response regulator